VADTCKSCGQPIVWVTMLDTGKAMPIDKTTIEKRVVLDGPWSRGAVRDTGLSHFATCPNAAEHRKPKPARPADPACPHCHGEGYATDPCNVCGGGHG